MAGEAWAMLEQDLAATLESDFAAPVALITPAGVLIDTSAHGGPLLGRVQYDYVLEQPGGERVVVNEPVVILRLSSLSVIPKAGENWAIQIPTSPSDPTPRTFKLGGSRAPEVAATIGFVRLFPQKAEQA
jgi:hypothetical protein